MRVFTTPMPSAQDTLKDAKALAPGDVVCPRLLQLRPVRLQISEGRTNIQLLLRLRVPAHATTSLLEDRVHRIRGRLKPIETNITKPGHHNVGSVSLGHIA